jgi:hypothetical protein
VRRRSKSLLLVLLTVIAGCQGVQVFARFDGELAGTLDRRPGEYGCLFLKADDGYIYDFVFLQASGVFEQNGVVIDGSSASVAKPGDRVVVSGEIVHYSKEGPTIASPFGNSPAGCLPWSVQVESISVTR